MASFGNSLADGSRGAGAEQGHVPRNSGRGLGWLREAAQRFRNGMGSSRIEGMCLFSLGCGSKMASVGVLSRMAPEGRRRTGTSAEEFRPQCRSREGARGRGLGGEMGSLREGGMGPVFLELGLENGFGWCFVGDGSGGTAPYRDKCRGIPAAVPQLRGIAAERCRGGNGFASKRGYEACFLRVPARNWLRSVILRRAVPQR
jgi:hypothetical protein